MNILDSSISPSIHYCYLSATGLPLAHSSFVATILNYSIAATATSCLNRPPQYHHTTPLLLPLSAPPLRHYLRCCLRYIVPPLHHYTTIISLPLQSAVPTALISPHYTTTTTIICATTVSLFILLPSLHMLPLHHYFTASQPLSNTLAEDHNNEDITFIKKKADCQGQ